MRNFLKRTAQGALLVLSLNGCANSRALVTNTTLEQRCDNKSFVDYIEDTNHICSLRTNESLLGREELFHRYLAWLCEISQTNFDPDDFSIIPDNEFFGFFYSGIPGIFTPTGMYWFGTIYVRTEGSTFPSIAHEFGHATDNQLGYLDYAFSSRSRVRAEAVAEAFELYTNIRLIQEGAKALENQFELVKPAIAAGRTLDDHLEHESRYISGRTLVYVLMSTLTNSHDVWHYLANTPEDEVYQRVNDIIIEKKGLAESVQSGYDRYTNERENAKDESINQ